MKYLLPILAALFAWNACGATEPARAGGPKTASSVELIPRVKYHPLTCKTHTEMVNGKTCTWSECRNNRYIWTDDIMRCTDDSSSLLDADHERDGGVEATEILPDPIIQDAE